MRGQVSRSPRVMWVMTHDDGFPAVP